MGVNDPDVLSMLVARLDRIEAKVDKLMAFRSYMMGVAAVFGMIGARIYYFIRGY